MQINAQVLTTELGPEKLTLDQPGAGEVQIQVAACGVCHTDLHVIKEEVAFPRPAVLGHEVSGVVTALGEGVDHVAVGDRVVCAFIMPCGDCRHCNRGLSEICEVFFAKNRLNGQLLDGTTRLHRPDGSDVAMYSMSGHTDNTVVPASAVYKLPDSVDLHQAAVLGCSIFTAYGSVYQTGELQPGETVAVVAAGGIGLAITHLAAAAGAQRIFVIDLDDEKLALAQQLGATDVINAGEQDAREIIFQELGHGVDVVFEALGSQKTVEQAVMLADDGGRVVLTGIAPPGHLVAAPIAHMVRRKIQVKGSFGASLQTAMPAVIELAAEGKLDLEALITDQYSFEQIPQAYQELADRKIRGRGVIKISEPAAQARS